MDGRVQSTLTHDIDGVCNERQGAAAAIRDDERAGHASLSAMTGDLAQASGAVGDWRRVFPVMRLQQVQ